MPTTFKDYYATLGVPRTATEKEIKTAFRKLARKYHPDVNQNNKDAEARFKEVTEAYEVLGDPEKRKTYDELGSQPQAFGAGFPPGYGTAGAGTAGGPQVQYRTVSPEELESLFGTTTNPFSDFFHDVFGRGLGRRPRCRRGRSSRVRHAAAAHPPARRRRGGGGGDQPRGGVPGHGPHPRADRCRPAPAGWRSASRRGSGTAPRCAPPARAAPARTAGRPATCW